jgi:hypothetical protein
MDPVLTTLLDSYRDVSTQYGHIRAQTEFAVGEDILDLDDRLDVLRAEQDGLRQAIEDWMSRHA